MLEWNPNDPDTVKVHYDVSAWSLEQRAELAEALAEAELAHIWDGDEVVVPEELEAEADALFEQLEQALGPFPVPLDEEDPGVEYGLDEWPAADRRTLAQALVDGEIPHRWDGTTVIVATDAEATVDDLLDAIEQGTLVLASDTGATAPEGALDRLFAAADRLARDADDRAGRDGLRELVDQLQPSAPPYGVSAATWARTVAAANELADLVDEDGSSSDIIGAAQALRTLVRQYV